MNAELRAPSPRQAVVLRFIAQHTAEHGYPPTLREVCDALGIGIASTNGASDHVDCLIRKGYLTRARFVARSVVLTARGKAFLEGLRETEGESMSDVSNRVDGE